MSNFVNGSLLKVSLVIFSTYAGSCNQSSLLETLPIRSVHVVSPFTKDTYSVDELLVNPQSFAHTVVTVRGCYVEGFEISAFTACDKRSGLIWVEDAGLLRKGAFRTFGKKELLFAYDERRNSHAWDKLSRSNVGREVLVRSIPGSEIVLLGQFETSDSSYGGFGHLGAYSNELILEDILSNE